MNVYQAQWSYLQSAWEQGRHPHAMMFVGALDRALEDITIRFTQLVLCKSKDLRLCQTCTDCHLAIAGDHPDVEWIKPEKNNGPIKIDQIRKLQHYSYLTPQRSAHRLIIIESADRMNTAAANSLLKILEEPAPHTLFLLLASQLSTVPPTVLSRCQIVRFSVETDLSDFSALAERYSPGSAQALVLKHAESILEQLIAVIEKKQHPCVVVNQWAQFELNALLWFFYLVYSQVQMILINKSGVSDTSMSQLIKLSSLLHPVIVFAQIDKINILQKKLSNNMNVNTALVLEDLLFDLEAKHS